MKILLLGKHGQLGVDLCRTLSQNTSLHLTALGRDECNVLHTQSIQALHSFDFDLLINCVAYTNVDHAESDTASAFQVNAFAVGELAKVCENKHAKFIHFSTDYVFGHLHNRQPLVETDTPSPINIYGLSLIHI